MMSAEFSIIHNYQVTGLNLLIMLLLSCVIMYLSVNLSVWDVLGDFRMFQTVELLGGMRTRPFVAYFSMFITAITPQSLLFVCRCEFPSMKE